MTFEQISEQLRKADIQDHRFEAKILIEELCGDFSEEKDYTCPHLYDALKRRIEHYPLQYIIENWDFYGLRFNLNDSCLVPRPDTETVAEQAIKLIPQNTRFCDLCAGSGCIGIAVLHNRHDLSCDAVELSVEAADIAVQNSTALGVSDRYSMLIGDVTRGECPSTNYSAIISNPPYIRTDVIPSLSPEVKAEPASALDGGEDGLNFYRAILDLYTDKLSDNGVFIFEIGYDQNDDIHSLAAERKMNCRTLKDLGGNYRVAIISP